MGTLERLKELQAQIDEKRGEDARFEDPRELMGLLLSVGDRLPKLLAVVEAGNKLAKAFPEAIAVLQREGYKDSAIEFKAVWSAYLRAKAEL